MNSLPCAGDLLPNGATVLAVCPLSGYPENAPRHQVLALRNDQRHGETHDRFVIWDINKDTWNTYWGWYFDTLVEAVEQFAKRANGEA